MSAAKKLPIPETPVEQPKNDVVRISPYPFGVDLLKMEGQPPMKGQVVKLTEIGFLMKVDTLNFYKVSEKYQLNFVLPVMEVSIRSQGKVVKTYDGIEQFNKETNKKQYLVEIHFIELPSNAKTSISNYLHKSGQKKF